MQKAFIAVRSATRSPFSLESHQIEQPNKRQTKNLSFELTTAPHNQSVHAGFPLIDTRKKLIDRFCPAPAEFFFQLVWIHFGFIKLLSV